METNKIQAALEWLNKILESRIQLADTNKSYNSKKVETAKKEIEIINIIREVLQDALNPWKPASEAPYDELCLFLTDNLFVTQGFIYDGDETDFGYTHYMPLPPLPNPPEKTK